MDMRGSQQPLRHYFAGLAEFVFESRLGVADPPLVDYLSQLLERFIRSDAVYKVRTPEGRRLGEVGEMLHDADARIGDARREVYRHIGDFTLFWAGLYPESLRQTRPKGTLDLFVDYCEHGKRSYLLASRLPTDDQRAASSDILERLSHEFELCVYGLGELKRELQATDAKPGDEPPRPWIIN